MSSAAPQTRCSKRRTINRQSSACASARTQSPKIASSGLLAVASENLLAGATDLRPVGLQAAEDTQRVVGIDLQLGLAKPGHVRMAGGALFVVALVHCGGRRLRRELLGGRGCCREHESDRQHRFPDHGSPLCGHPARRHSVNLSHTLSALSRGRPHLSGCAQTFAVVCDRAATTMWRRACALTRCRDKSRGEGRLAQLVERLLYTQDVGGSSPSPPTSLRSLRELRLGTLPPVAQRTRPPHRSAEA